MTVATALMNSQKTATNVQTRVSSSAATSAVFPRDGHVTLRTTAATILMRARRCARADTASVLNQSSPARMINVFPPGGSVMVKMIVGMVLMKLLAKSLPAPRIDLNVPLDTVSRKSLFVMEIRTVLMCLMN
jgi:hypothetical protein